MYSNTVNTQRKHRRIAASALIAAPLLLALSALGCGEQKEKATAELATNETATTQAAPTASQATVASTGALLNTGLASGATEAKKDATLPPDIVGVVPEGLSLPGSVVEIAAVGSPDVTSVMLSDRAGEKTPFTFDSESNLWRVSYRVPLRVATDKLALGVTATNETNRWKRIYVFLQVREEAAQPAEGQNESATPAEALPDSTTR